MKGRHHTPEQIVRKLREADWLLAEGHGIADVAKQLEISEQTFHRWRNDYGGMKVGDVKELRKLRDDNERLKQTEHCPYGRTGDLPRVVQCVGVCQPRPSVHPSTSLRGIRDGSFSVLRSELSCCSWRWCWALNGSLLGWQRF